MKLKGHPPAFPEEKKVIGRFFITSFCRNFSTADKHWRQPVFSLASCESKHLLTNRFCGWEACGEKSFVPGIILQTSRRTPHAPRLANRPHIPDRHDPGLQRQRRGIVVDHPTVASRNQTTKVNIYS